MFYHIVLRIIYMQFTTAQKKVFSMLYLKFRGDISYFSLYLFGHSFRETVIADQQGSSVLQSKLNSQQIFHPVEIKYLLNELYVQITK